MMIGLEQLIEPLTVEEFTGSVWPHRRHVSHGDLARFGEIAAIPELASLENLLDHIDRVDPSGIAVQAWFTDADGKHTQATVSARSARALYGLRQVTIVVDNIERIFPAIQSYLERVSGQLPSPQDPVSCHVYASPIGKGTRMHFDRQENFFLQMRGCKIWTIAENANVRVPHQNFAVGNPIPGEMSTYCPVFASRMPEGRERVELKPGSVLYVPRGYWHEAETSEESLALTLTFPTRSWVDVVASKLRSTLVRREEWREPVVARGDPDAYLARLIAELPEHLRGLTLADLLDDAVRPTRYRLVPGKILAFDRDAVQGHWKLKFRHSSDEAEMRIDSELAPIVSWTMTFGRPFTLGEVTEQFGGLGLTGEKIRIFLILFRDLGIFE